MPTEKAHGIQVMKMCEAFADLGKEVELWVPNRRTFIKEAPHDYYQVKKNFKIKKIWCLDLVKFGKLGFWIEEITFSKLVSILALFNKGIFFTRDELCAVYLKILGKNPLWEAHMGHKNILINFLIKTKTPTITITRGLKNLYENLGVGEDLILVSPDGVDMDQFNIDLSKEEARDKLGLPKDKKIILYAGHLYSWKGADTLADASLKISSEYAVLFVGGTKKDIEDFREKHKDKNILVVNKKPQKEMPTLLKAADILILPNSSKENISRLYTSPMKLFEYMASKRPIVASDLPSLREILNEGNAYFFEADNPDNLATIINIALKDQSESESKALKAFEKVKGYTWNKRAESILNFIK